MADINRVPRGLLGLLDAKTGGKTPAAVNRDLQTVLDATQMYLADVPLDAEATIGTIGSGNIGNLANLVTVPSGELWFVYGVSVSAVAGVAGLDEYDFDIGVDTNTGIGVHFLTSSINHLTTMYVLSQFETVEKAVNFDPPLIFGPGTSFGIWVSRLWTQTATTTTSVLRRSVTV